MMLNSIILLFLVGVSFGQDTRDERAPFRGRWTHPPEFTSQWVDTTGGPTLGSLSEIEGIVQYWVADSVDFEPDQSDGSTITNTEDWIDRINSEEVTGDFSVSSGANYPNWERAEINSIDVVQMTQVGNFEALRGETTTTPIGTFRYLHDGAMWLAILFYVSGTLDTDQMLVNTEGNNLNNIGFRLELNTNNTVTLAVADGSGSAVINHTSTATVSDNSWNYIIVDNDSLSVTLFVNSTAESPVVNRAYSQSNETNLITFGRESDINDRFFVGSYREIAFGGGGLYLTNPSNIVDFWNSEYSLSLAVP